MPQSPDVGAARRPPLEGVVVVDLGQIYNVPYATLLLALAGAQVIKVEALDGELSRRRLKVNVGAGVAFFMLNSNKKGVTLNLKDPRGRQLLLDMADRAAVLVENFRPGVMDKLGIGAAAVMARCPSLIYASGSGYGQQGDYRDLAAMDLTVQAMSGAIASTGFPDGPPVKCGPALSDFLGGIHLYGAIVTALYRRLATGAGAHLDVAMLDSVVPSLMSNIGPHVGATLGEVPDAPERTGNHQGGMSESPYNVYPTKDGYVTIICLEEHHWTGLLAAMERTDVAGDPRFVDKQSRIKAMVDVDALIEQWTSQLSTAEVFDRLRDESLVCSPVRSLGDVVSDPHLVSRGLFKEMEVPGVGRMPLLQTPLHFAGEERVALDVAPGLGEHNDEIYGRWLGRSADELAELRADGVI